VKAPGTLSESRRLPLLPCACANLRRAARAVTRLYNGELQPDGIELTQFTLLMTLDRTGEISQGKLGNVLALDSTSLTRMLKPLQKRGWIKARVGEDRRHRFLRLTPSGREKLQQCLPHWEQAQRKLQQGLSEPIWAQLGELLAQVTRASGAA
jgi:DNA-binding MarR family transcriptional regulator